MAGAEFEGDEAEAGVEDEGGVEEPESGDGHLLVEPPTQPTMVLAAETIHSVRSAIIGSTRLARRAGIQQARKAIVRSRRAMKVKVIWSEALTP